MLKVAARVMSTKAAEQKANQKAGFSGDSTGDLCLVEQKDDQWRREAKPKVGVVGWKYV